MYAMLIDPNKRLVWSEIPDPTPKANEVIIEVHAAALNRADLMQRNGDYPSPPDWPEWMGLEVAGTILEAPSGSRWKPGDAVCALLGGGGYAEKIAVPAEMVLPVPQGLSMAEAAAIPEAFATSYLNLCLEAEMKAGDTVFIQAGASGLGMAAIQLAKASGAQVMTTVGSPEKAEFVRQLGADIIVNRRTDDLGAIMDANPVDIAMDCVVGASMGANVVKMRNGGRWIVIATLAGAKTEIDMNLYFRKGLKLIGSTLRSRTSEVKAQILAAIEDRFWAKFSTGEIKVILNETLPIEQAEAAHDILIQQKNLGKVVLTLR
tara:strand:- start:4128 stop:5084 length:957 start_codon:yes stop_codon:yes gene_type:complete